MAKKKNRKKSPKVHEDLKGFEININEFGEIKTSYNANTINDFLNKNVVDKKLQGLEDIEPLAEDKNGKEDEDVLFNE